MRSTAALVLLLASTSWGASPLTRLDGDAAAKALAEDPVVAPPELARAGDGEDTESLEADGLRYAMEVTDAGVTVTARKGDQLVFRTRGLSYAGPSATLALSPKHGFLELKLARTGVFLYEARTGRLAAQLGFFFALSPDETWAIDPPEPRYAMDVYNRATVLRFTLAGRRSAKAIARLPLKLDDSDEQRTLRCAISADGALYAVLDPKHQLIVYRAKDDAPVGKVAVDLDATGLDFTRSGRHLVVTRNDRAEPDVFELRAR